METQKFGSKSKKTAAELWCCSIGLLASQEVSVRWNDLGYPNHLRAEIRDLWQHKDLGTFEKDFPHGSSRTVW